MATSSTIAEIARQAGVGTATVDRVIYYAAFTRDIDGNRSKAEAFPAA